ncbi:MAG TPA: FecR family protein [Terriglobales bacterium]|jgi:hypothetical protein|nr:FecR family protein [Terriglobales bacterium]
MFSPNRFTFLLTLTASVCFLAASCLADSQVRIVRLSSVQGDVQIDRATGEGFETAFDNLPITQGAKIKTRADGRAEVEFEDGSTVRIAPLSVVEFPALSLRDSGAKVSTIDVKHGTAYVNFAGKKDDEFTLNFDKEHIAVTDASRFRVFVAADGSMVSVFNGNLNVDAPSGQVAVEKKHSASFLPDQDQPRVAKSVPELEFDDWDKSQQQYHDRYMAKANDVSPYAYGMSDMNYYGSFSNIPGYGMGWQPYFAGAGWDPYMNGSWASYPGVGYTWVSAYPWGWTPYHYGSWSNIPGYGWVWMPGGSWAGYGRTPMVAGITRPGLRVPSGGGGRTLMVNRGPVSSVRSNKIVINNGSAGLGVARGSLRNPAQISQQVSERGSVRTGVRNTPITAPPPTYSPAARPGVYTGQTATSGRTMSAPSSAGRSMGGSGGGMGGGASRPSSAGSTRR